MPLDFRLTRYVKIQFDFYLPLVEYSSSVFAVSFHVPSIFSPQKCTDEKYQIPDPGSEYLIESQGLWVIRYDLVPAGDSKSKIKFPLLLEYEKDTLTSTCSRLSISHSSPLVIRLLLHTSGIKKFVDLKSLFKS